MKLKVRRQALDYSSDKPYSALTSLPTVIDRIPGTQKEGVVLGHAFSKKEEQYTESEDARTMDLRHLENSLFPWTQI